MELASNPIIRSFKNSIMCLRPSRPRYTATWDPTPLLNCIENLPLPLSLKTLSYKLTTLLALITGERLQTISLIRLSNIIQGPRETVINISDLIKTSYCDRTVPLIRDPNTDFLFITHKIPHNRASKDTLSRWVKQNLTSAGIDTTAFKSHSAGLRKGVYVDIICKTAGWSQQSTFASFGNCPLYTNK
nr:unnamed protein product [Callosobruchus chinensis]